MRLLRLLLLPLRAPLLLVLFGVAIVMGNHWTLLHEHLALTRDVSARLFWTVEVTQVLAVVVLCAMPDLLMRQVSLMMASSRIVSFVVTLLLVVTAGIYVLRLNLLADVLIIASAVLLARLDLTRIGVVPSSSLTVLLLSGILLGGIWLGHLIPTPRLFATIELLV